MTGSQVLSLLCNPGTNLCIAIVLLRSVLIIRNIFMAILLHSCECLKVWLVVIMAYLDR